MRAASHTAITFALVAYGDLTKRLRAAAVPAPRRRPPRGMTPIMCQRLDATARPWCRSAARACGMSRTRTVIPRSLASVILPAFQGTRIRDYRVWFPDGQLPSVRGGRVRAIAAPDRVIGRVSLARGAAVRNRSLPRRPHGSSCSRVMSTRASGVGACPRLWSDRWSVAGLGGIRGQLQLVRPAGPVLGVQVVEGIGDLHGIHDQLGAPLRHGKGPRPR
jgi:hypothetical protein